MEVIADNFLSQETGPYSEQDLQALQEAEQQEQQEELIGGKFKSPDDLLRAYQELEKKLGSRTGYEKAEGEPEAGDDQAAEEPVILSQEEEATIPDAPLDEQVQTDTIPDGRQIVEPLILEEMPKYKEPNVYTIIDAADMPERTKRALQDLEDHGLATFDMEDELFEELDFESL